MEPRTDIKKTVIGAADSRRCVNMATDVKEADIRRSVNMTVNVKRSVNTAEDVNAAAEVKRSIKGINMAEHL